MTYREELINQTDETLILEPGDAIGVSMLSDPQPGQDRNRVLLGDFEEQYACESCDEKYTHWIWADYCCSPGTGHYEPTSSNGITIGQYRSLRPSIRTLPTEDDNIECHNCGEPWGDHWDERKPPSGPSLGEDWRYTCPGCGFEVFEVGT